MNRHLTICLAAGIAFLMPTQTLFAQSETQTATGPINSGLSLQLITGHAGKKDSKNKILIRLINKSDQDLALKSHRTSFTFGDYGEYLKAHIDFSSYPKIYPSPSGIDGGGGTVREVEVTLKPGETIDVKFAGASKLLYSGELRQSTYRFERSGKYFIRAHAHIQNANGKKIHLWSNEATYIVGNSQKQPQPSTAKVTEFNAAESSAKINIGKTQGVQVGDAFVILGPNGSYGKAWQMIVKQVDDKTATGTAQPSSTKGYSGKLPPPDVGSIASLIQSADARVGSR